MPYKIGFALTTALGNHTRYINLRKYADRDPDTTCIWAPIKHYLDPDPYRHFPGPIQKQLILNHETSAILKDLNSFDAVAVHAFQLFSYLSLLKMLHRRPLLIWYQDYAPFPAVEMLVNYGHNIRESWRRKTRYRLESWFTRQADIYFPWSNWAKESLIHDHGISAEKIHVVNIGVDLELWPYIPKEPQPDAPPRILFVGGDFERKGGSLLLDLFARHFADVASLDLVTREAPTDLPRNVTVYTDMKPNDPRLRTLYAEADLFVLPTRADMSSYAGIEAMATGRPVISSNVGGIPDLICEGQSGFLVEPRDGTALRDRIQRLITDPDLRRHMGEAGRKRVESDLNAETGAKRILAIIKAFVDAQRRGRSPQLPAKTSR